VEEGGIPLPPQVAARGFDGTKPSTPAKRHFFNGLYLNIDRFAERDFHLQWSGPDGGHITPGAGTDEDEIEFLILASHKGSPQIGMMRKGIAKEGGVTSDQWTSARHLPLVTVFFRFAAWFV
jgi:hypothetical protein